MRINIKITAAALALTTLFAAGCKKDKIKTGKVMPEETPYAYTVSQLGDDVMPIMSYIAPMGEVTVDGQTYPSSITDEVYSKLKEIGIKISLWTASDFTVTKIGHGQILKCAINTLWRLLSVPEHGIVRSVADSTQTEKLPRLQR